MQLLEFQCGVKEPTTGGMLALNQRGNFLSVGDGKCFKGNGVFGVDRGGNYMVVNKT